MQNKKLLILLAFSAVAALFFALDVGRVFSLEFLKAQQASFAAVYAQQPVAVTCSFVAVYVLITALSLPGAAIMTLAAGASFGLVWGTVVVSLASTLGATLAMLAARYLLRNAIQSRFGPKLAEVNAGIDREGGLYLFTLRLAPVIPFVALNLLMGLTRMKVWTFFWVSELGMLAGTMAYVNAGTEIAKITSLRSVLSPGLIGSLALLGLLPLVVKKAMDYSKRRKKAGVVA